MDKEYKEPENGIPVDEEIETDEELEESTEDTEIEEEDSDEELENDSDDNTDNDTTDSDTDSTDNKIVITVDGKPIEIDSTEELIKLAEKGLKVKNSYEQAKDIIATYEGLKENGVEDVDLYLLAKAKKGDKKALAKLLKQTGLTQDELYEIEELIDSNEIDNYQVDPIKADANEIEVKRIINEVKKDPNTYQVFENLLTNEFDTKSKQEVFNNPELLDFIASTIKSGIFDKIAPKYMKNKLLGKAPTAIANLLDAYEEYVKEESNNKTKSNKKIVSKRKKASASVKNKKTKTDNGKPDFKNMTPEEFDAYYEKIMGSY